MDTIEEKIIIWMADTTHNRLDPESPLPCFDTPLVGFGRGDDPLFLFLKNDIGSEFYWTPAEAFNIAFPEQSADAGDISVISWILPHTRDTRRAHGKQKKLPSIEWSKARHFGEKINDALRRFVVSTCIDAGYRACAPVHLKEWNRALSSQYGFASSWSERHTAHVCGLGTFGMSDGLITDAGKAMRVGSVIVKKNYPPTERKYSSHNQYCLYATQGKCLVCAKRCPVSAISENGHDKEKCKQYIRETTSAYVEKEQLGIRVNSCGLCQTRVPCEFRNPTPKQHKPQ